jgi:membrane-associated protein
MLALIQELVDWVGPAFAAAGYWIIAAIVVMERSIFLGLIVPGDIVMALGGVYAARGDLDLVAVMVVGFLASAAGESIGYWLGNRHGVGLVSRLPFGDRLKRRLEAGRKHFREHGVLTVAFGRYATGAGSFIPFIVGAGDMPYHRFLAVDLAAIAVWAVGVALLGYLLGRNLELVDSILSNFGWIMLGLLVLAVAGRILWKRYRKRRASA